MTQRPALVTRTPDVDLRVLHDPLAVVPQVLDLVRLSGAIFFQAEFHGPWAYTSPPTQQLAAALPEGTGSLVMFHIIAEGSCWVRMHDGERCDLVRGDIVVMPYGDAHAFGSMSAATPVPITTLLPPHPWTEFPCIDFGAQGDREYTRIVCGFLRGDALLFDPVLRALPSQFVVHPPAGPIGHWMQASIEYAELASRTAGPVAQADPRLPELLFKEVLRLYLHDHPNVTGWLAALRDPIVGRALSLLHANPARDWTVTELATCVTSSRTVLVDRFSQLLGRPPIRYLTDWRLHLASGLLCTTDLGVAEIGAKVGYNNEEVFSRAFKRALGKAPAHWRAAG